MVGILTTTSGLKTKIRPRVGAIGGRRRVPRALLNFLPRGCWIAAPTRLGQLIDPMTPKRVSFGFDLRVNPELQQWDDEVRQSQRLVPTLTSPVSADPAVWIEGGEIDSLLTGVVPDYANPLYLAKRIDLLLDECRKRSIPTSGLVSVCITSAETNLIALAAACGPGYFDSPLDEEELLSGGWKLAGFDVVDLNGLISGLKGIGYVEPTWSQLRGFFGGTLNELGLFGDCETASHFAAVRGLQITAHAPFIVVGVLTGTPA